MNPRHLILPLAFWGCLFSDCHRALSQNWAATSSPYSPYEVWTSIASSADGTKVVAAEGSPGQIYVSSDAGANWTATTVPSDYWTCVASSADGTKLVAVSCAPNYYGGQIRTSTNSGEDWISNSPPSGFNLGISVASSADGRKLAMVSFNSDSGTFTAMCISTNSGFSWTVPSQPYNLSSSWNSVASSADGTKLVATDGYYDDVNYVYVGHIFRSIDSGLTWSATSVPATIEYGPIACSADGAHLVAASSDGRLYTSTNSGNTWLAQTVPWNNSSIASAGRISSVAASANGACFFAVTSSGLIYTSTNAGVTWTNLNVAAVPWTSVTCSTNGTKAYAGTSRGPIYSLPYSGNWKLSSAPGTNYTSVASSADGTHLVAASTDPGPIWINPSTELYPGGPIYTSTDSGASWSKTSAVSNWVCLTSSTDGTKLAAASYQYNTNAPATSFGSIFTSTNAGDVWTPTSAPDVAWNALAASADGRKLLAVAGHSIYTSTNSGATWTLNNVPSYPWAAVASSANGNQLVATTGFFSLSVLNYVGYVFLSTNSGETWAGTSVPTTNEYGAIACSADGSQLVAVSTAGPPYGGPLYTSSDSGVTWAMNSVLPVGDWGFVASSADGSRLVATDTWGRITLSSDAGASWAWVNAPALPWTALALSGDGSTLVAAFEGGIYVSPLTSSSKPALTIKRSGSKVYISWPTNATGFGLQQSSALGSHNWVGVTNTVSIVNALNQVSVTATNRASFYRLQSP